MGLGDERRRDRMRQVIHIWVTMGGGGASLETVNNHLEGGWEIVATHFEEGSVLYILGDPT